MTIEQALSDKFCMFYKGGVDPTLLTPGQSLENSLNYVNYCLHTLGTNIAEWPWGDQDEATRLVRVNWIYQNLQQEPIRKPILIDHLHRVICGDTRLMALFLLKDLLTVNVVMVCPIHMQDQYNQWIQIHNNQDLIQATNFEPNAHVLVEADSAGISWLEIGDQSTAHHLHDHDTRVVMMTNYLKTQSADFEITKQWCTDSIDWLKFT
jgi:hypothetical protein